MAGSPGDLEAALEAALMDCLAGEPWGPTMAGSLERAARAVLMGQGLSGARIQVRRLPDGVAVEVALPPGPARVRRLVVTLRG